MESIRVSGRHPVSMRKATMPWVNRSRSTITPHLLLRRVSMQPLTIPGGCGSSKAHGSLSCVQHSTAAERTVQNICSELRPMGFANPTFSVR
eukprot:684357-Pyramimonas_sp.AAC.1